MRVRRQIVQAMMVLTELSRFQRQLKQQRNICSPFSDSMLWSTSKLVMWSIPCCQICWVVKGTSFNWRFWQKQLCLPQIFGRNSQKREKHVCFCCICLLFFIIYFGYCKWWFLTSVVPRLNFSPLILFDLWVAFSPNSLSDPWDKKLR